MRSVIVAVFTGTLMLASGCASWLPFTRGEAPGNAPATLSVDELVARDFARAIVQIPMLSPASTTVRFDQSSAAGEPFLDALQSSLRQAGYGIQITNETGRPNRVSHTEQRATEPGGSIFSTHETAIGSVRFRRQYRIDVAGQVSPAGALFVKGADASALVMDDRLFDLAPGELPGTAEVTVASIDPDPTTDKTSAVLSPIASKRVLPKLPLTASISAPLISQAQASSRASASSGFGTSGNTREILPYTRNVFDIGQSNFEDLLGDYQNIDERILVFGNDSMRLDSGNRGIIETMVKSFDSRRDVMSLVGCSLGPTRIANGNQTLALGRANRVKEALVLAGVPQDRILDEGCWAGEADVKMPGRGVVITHRRERA